MSFFKSLSLRSIRELIKGYETEFLRGFYESEGLCYEHKRTLSIYMYNSNKELIEFVCEILTELGFNAEVKDRGYPKGAKKRAYEVRVRGWKESVMFILLIRPVIKIPQWIKSVIK